MSSIQNEYNFTLNKIGELNSCTSYIIELHTSLLGLKFFYVEEEKAFYKSLEIGDKLLARADTSPKFRECILWHEVRTLHGDKIDISDRRILIHGSNEDGQVTNANSANCWIPLRELNYSISGGKFISQFGVSKAVTRRWVKELHKQGMSEFTVALQEIKDSL